MRRPRLSGMVCSRNPRNMSASPNLISQRKRSALKKSKSAMICRGGLLDGHKLFLSTSGTMPFSIGGVSGFYDHKMNWVQL